MPATIDGIASGSSTCRSSSPPVIPIATPASRIVRSMPCRPAIVVRTIGSRPYRIKTTTAVRGPTPPRNGSGSRKPNIARLGMVCTRLASATSGALNRGRRAAKIPSGTPMATASAVDAPTSSTCWPIRPASSARCESQNCRSADIPQWLLRMCGSTASSSRRTSGFVDSTIVSGGSQAMSAPWSSTATRSASASASSMSCVTMTTVLPTRC